MLSLIPPAMAITIMLGIMMLTTQRASDTDISKSLANNMLRHHEHHYEFAKASGFELGTIISALPYPMEAMTTWHSEVVEDGSGSHVITWPEDFGLEGAFTTNAFKATIVTMSSPGDENAVIGIVTIDDAGAATVSGHLLPDTILPIPDGAPVMMR